MERRFFLHAFFFLLPFFFYGCEGINGKLKLVEGNFFFSRGMVNEAIGAYLDALQYPETAPYANFALGSTYLALEQTDAALERFTEAEKTLPHLPENRDLLYRIRYNSGVTRFERGEYQEAAGDFRSALEADSSAREAKRNLELSLISLHIRKQTSDVQNNEAGSVAADGNHANRGDIIFEYIRQKETDKWKSWKWTGSSEESGPDY